MAGPYILGPCKVYAIPPSTAADPSPFPFMDTQEVNVDIKYDSKDLYGGEKDALVTALTRRTLTGKLKMPQIQGSAVSKILGSSLASGGKRAVFGESTGVIAGATYTVAHPTGFELLTILDENGYVMKKVAATPAAGEYVVTSGGVFTFNAAANGLTYTTDYRYTDATLKTIAINTEQMGLAPQFKMVGHGLTVEGLPYGWDFGAVTFLGLTLGWKQEDFIAPDVDFKIFRPRNSANIGNMYLPDAT